MDPEQAIAAIAVPVASLMIQLDILARFANTYFAHRIDTHVENMNFKAIERNFCWAQHRGRYHDLFLYFSRWLSVAD